MGMVYAAEDHRLNRRIALKFLAPHLVGYGQNRERFVKEARPRRRSAIPTCARSMRLVTRMAAPTSSWPFSKEKLSPNE